MEVIIDGTKYAPEKREEKLLSDAQVGWICLHRNGAYSQILETKYSSTFRIVTDLSCNGNSYSMFTIGGIYGFRMNDLDIISTEPLAKEGSKEWAWQKMLLKNRIVHCEWGKYIGHYYLDNGQVCFASASGDTRREAGDKKDWIARAGGDGWQIYEPAEPDKYPNVEVGDIVYAYYPSLEAHIKKLGQEQDDMYSAVVEVLPTQFIVNNGFGFYKKDGSVSRIPGRQQFFDELCVLKIEKPTKEPEQKVTAPRLKVGDWVEMNIYNNHQGKIKEIFEDGMGELYGTRIHRTNPTFTITGLSGEFAFASIARKLDPSEVKVKITLEGTVCSYGSDGKFFQMNKMPSGYTSIIAFSDLTPSDAELVRELVEQ